MSLSLLYWTAGLLLAAAIVASIWRLVRTKKLLDVESGTTETIPVHVRSEKRIAPALRFPVEVRGREALRVQRERAHERRELAQAAVFREMLEDTRIQDPDRDTSRGDVERAAQGSRD